MVYAPFVVKAYNTCNRLPLKYIMRLTSLSQYSAVQSFYIILLPNPKYSQTRSTYMYIMIAIVQMTVYRYTRDREKYIRHLPIKNEEEIRSCLFQFKDINFYLVIYGGWEYDQYSREE